MPKIISVHSFRCGTGKTNLTANLAVLLAGRGRRVGVLDADLRSPGLHILFDLPEDAACSFNDYLGGKCPIEQTAQDVTPPELPRYSKLYLVPASTSLTEIMRLLQQPYDNDVYTRGLRQLIHALQLDILIADIHAGLHAEAMVQIAASDTLLVIMRPDHNDYRGTAILIELAQRLGVPRVELIVNQVPLTFDLTQVQARIEQTYQCQVSATLHHSVELMALGSAGLFVLRYPFHSVTATLNRMASKLVD